MRLSWKLFFITTPLFVLFLTIFGSWMIQEIFSTSLEREIERCMTENEMFQNSYELTRHSLSDEQREQMTTKRLVESFYRKGKSADGCARIYDEEGTVLYESSDLQPAHSVRESLNETQNAGYELVRVQDRTYAVVVSRSSFGVYIENIQDITHIFSQRADLYARYQTGLLAMTFLVGGLILLVLFLVMRNMKKLSDATRRFARGRYETRLDIRSTDEVGMLAEDFNWMANAMNTQMEQLQGEVQRQEEFTAAFAHELKTPLTSIIGYADMIRQLKLSEEETDLCADYIFRQGKRLQSLSYKLLEMTMAGNHEIVWRAVSVEELFADVQRTVQVSLDEKSLKLISHAAPGCVQGDRDLLASVLINLIDNARKASEPGSSIWLSGDSVPDGYRIMVEDEGGGLPPEELSRITQAFYMVDKSRSRKEGGAGLGLALCQKIVDLHRGAWQIENIPEGGLRVTVLLNTAESVQRFSRSRRSSRRERLTGR